MRIPTIALALIALTTAAQAEQAAVALEPPAACAGSDDTACALAVLKLAEREALGIGDPAVPGEAALVAEMMQRRAAAATVGKPDEAPEERAERLAMLARLQAQPELAIAPVRFAILTYVAMNFVGYDRPAEGNRLVPAMMVALDRSETIETDPNSGFGDLATYIAGAQAEFGFFEDALVTAGQIDDPDERADALAKIAGSQAKRGLVQEALDLADRIEDPAARNEALSKAAVAQAEAGDVDGAMATAARIGEGSRSTTAWTAIAEAQAARDDFAGALAAAARIGPEVWGDAPQKVATLGRIAQRQAEVGQLDAARATFAQAEELARTPDMVREPRRVLSGLVDQQVAAGLFDEAIATAGRGGSASLRSRAYRSVASAQAEAGRDAQARSSLRSAAEAAATMANADGKNRDCGSQELLAVAKAQLALGLMPDAWETAEMVGDDGGRMETYLAIAAAAKADAAARAFAAAREIAAGDAPRLARIAVREAAAGFVDAARATFAAAADKAVQTEDTELLAEIAADQIEAGFHADAAATAERIAESGRRSSVQIKIAAALAAAGRTDAARDGFLAALRSTRETDDPEGKPWTLLKIAQDQATAGLAEDAAGTSAEAMRAAQSIEDPDDRAGVLTRIAMVQAQAGARDAARQSFAAAREAKAMVARDQDGIDDFWAGIPCLDSDPFIERSVEAAEAKAGFLDDVLQSAGRKPYAACRAAALINIARGIKRPTLW